MRGSRHVRGAIVRAAREAPAVQQRARDELQRLGPAEQPAGDVGRDAVADGVLLGARREAGGQAGEHRGLPEELADAQQVEHAPVQDELDGAAAHDAQVPDRLGALGEDRRAGRVVLDLGGGGDAPDIGVVERVERRVVAQEVGDLGRRGGGQPLARASLDGWAERASWISMSAHFSPIIIVVMHGLIAGRNGMIEPSATRSPCTPRTRRRGSTTASGSESGPMCAVQAGW